jgi:hypothetical protein
MAKKSWASRAGKNVHQIVLQFDCAKTPRFARYVLKFRFKHSIFVLKPFFQVFFKNNSPGLENFLFKIMLVVKILILPNYTNACIKFFNRPFS